MKVFININRGDVSLFVCIFAVDLFFLKYGIYEKTL